jgi:beta-lactamase class A
MWRKASIVVFIAGVVSFSLAYVTAAQAVERPSHHVASITAQVGDTTPPPPLADETPPPPPPDPAPAPAPAPAHPSFGPLTTAVNAIVSASGAPVGVSLIELGGTAPATWSAAGSVPMDAASTYKLPALMAEAQGIAEGRVNPAGTACFQDSDWEDGWFQDYTAGDCYSRNELAYRAGHFSDNTAGHMLVRDIGGAAALNAYAVGLGAVSSSFFDGNQTTSDDLARLLAAEATGNAGGPKAQLWLYPYLTNSKFESGVPAGVPAGTLVIHKTGELDPEVNDAAIVSGGHGGAYVLVVMTDGRGGDTAWSLIARISAAVWAYEATR